MDRLLTDEEIKNAVYDKPEKGSARWTKTVIPRDNKVAKAQDAKTASLVAQEIIQDYENAFEPTVPMSITYEKHHAIKSKWGIE
jgi:hypothetical protein